MPAISPSAAASRRAFLTAAGGAALAPAAAALLGASLARTAHAAPTDALPDYARIPAEAFGPQLNADGYFVG
jgi:hypothetical protein